MSFSGRSLQTLCRCVSFGVGMDGSGCGSADFPVGGVLSVEGLPPLPKGLSGILSSSGGSWRDIEKVHSKRARIQADISGDAPRGHSTPGGPDAALAVLRKEMVGLRQLDMSLLCQLWSLHEAIQEYKGSSEASFGADNVYSEEEEEEEDDGEVEDDEETVVLTQPSSSSLSLSLPPPRSNSRDQWIKDSFHIA
uniref:Family with sequence similarity 89 member B n=2 Tax=Echeneis naucrates TaxID=173247 RepID=A0A665U8C2_ECHNA